MPLFKFNEDTNTNYYAYLIEGVGDDVNDGLTPQTAVASINRLVEVLDAYAGTLRRVAVIQKHLIINEALTTARTSSKPIIFLSVSGTIIDGSAPNYISTAVSNDTWINFQIQRYDGFKFFANFASSAFITFVKCKFFANTSVMVNIYVGAINLQECVVSKFYVRAISPNAAIRLEIFNSVVLDLRISTYRANISSLYTLNSIYESINLSSSSQYTIDYCCVPGSISIWNQDELVALGLNTNGLAASPQFNDPTSGVYSVRSTSPMLYRGYNGEHIGIGEALWISAIELFADSEIVNNIALQSGRLIRLDDSKDALYQSSIKSIGSTRTIDMFGLMANLGFIGDSLVRSITVLSEGYPNYDGLQEYHYGSTITDSGIKYFSIQNENLGKTPSSEPTWWERMTWWAAVHQTGKVVQYTDGKWYRANQETSSTWEVAEWDQVVPADYLTFRLKYGRTFNEANNAEWKDLPFNQPALIDSNGNLPAMNDFDPSNTTRLRFNYYKLQIHLKTII